MNNIILPVMLDNNAYMPERAHADDAGIDLRSPIKVTIAPQGSAVIDTGVHVAIPKGYAGLLVSKSGLNVKGDLTSTGLIDCGYTGSVRVKLYNHGKEWRTIEEGDKITQLIVLPYLACSPILVDCLADTERGDNGFGSSGR